MNRRNIVVLSGNSGLGLGIVEDLLESDNWNVFSTYRTTSASLKALYEKKGFESLGRVLQADLCSWSEVLKTFESISVTGDIWGVINCSGEASAKTIKNLSTEDVAHSLHTNALSAFNVTKCAFSFMSRNTDPGGRIIHLSSVVVRRPVLGVVPYAMSKSAIEGLVKSAAGELGRKAVTINALRLGYFDKGMAKRDVPPELLTQISKQSAIGQLGSTENLVAALNYLLSVEASFHTGSVIEIDGGLI